MALPHREAKMLKCRPAFGWYELATLRLENQVRIFWKNFTLAVCPALVAKMKPDTDAVADRHEVLIGTPEALQLVSLAHAERGSY